MPAYGQDNFTFRRDYRGSSVLVIAHYIPRLELWGVIIKINGELVDHTQSDDPWKAAREAVNDAFPELRGEGSGPPRPIFRLVPTET